MIKFVSCSLPIWLDHKSLETNEFAELNEAVYLALDPGRGTLVAECDQALRIKLTPGDPQPDWCELVLKMQDPRWLDCRSLTATLCAASQETTSVKIALRIFKGGGFQNFFLTSDLIIAQSPGLHRLQLDVSPDMRHMADGCALHVFLDNNGCVLDIHDLEILGHL